MPLLYPPQAANDASPSQPVAASQPSPAKSVLASIAKPTTHHTAPNRLGSSLPNSLIPAQESMVHDGRLSVLGLGRPSATPVVSSGKPAMARNVNSLDSLQILQFLKRAAH